LISQRPAPCRHETGEKGIIAIAPLLHEAPFPRLRLHRPLIKELTLNHDNDTNNQRDGRSRLRAFLIERRSALCRAIEKMQSIPPDTFFSIMRTPYRIAALLAAFYVLIRHAIEHHDMDTISHRFNALSPDQQHFLLTTGAISIGVLVVALLGIWFACRAIRAFVVHNFTKRLAPDESRTIVPLLKALQTSLWVGVVVSFIATIHAIGVHPHISSALIITSYAFAAAALLTGACEKHALKAAVSNEERAW
jgi:hypothetical protein